MNKTISSQPPSYLKQDEKVEESAASRNISTSAYRVLSLFLLLMQHRSLTLLELNFLLLKNPHIQRTYNNETITKYVNTLRAAGCDIPPANRGRGFQYTLKQNPLPYLLPEVCLDTLVSALEVSRLLPDKQTQNKLINLTELVLWGLIPTQKDRLAQALPLLSEKDPSPEANPEPHKTNNPNGVYSKEEMEAFCLCGQQLQIEYALNSLGVAQAQKQSLTIEAQRLTRQGSKLFLQCIETTRQSRLLLAVERMTKVQKLPSRVLNKTQTLTVIFQLNGRLAKTYRPYPKEEPLKGSDENTLLVRAECDAPYQLAQRLLRYGASCQVISPVSLQRFMLQKTEEKLHCLNEPNSLQALFDSLGEEHQGEERSVV
jgi:hypothetical protein